ncbi:MAG: signal peptidase I [Lactimicrobium massiliense]|nr:signal peptidase I [Lactimicrobium massiliense]MDD6674482.1 signal peptidase I [Lactimicrobium massiliense]
MKKSEVTDIPPLAVLEQQLKEEKKKRRFYKALRSVIATLVTVAAVAVLVAQSLMPVLRIYGNSMNPTLSQGNVVVALKSSNFKTGDIVAFYWNNKILIKRAIAMPGDWVDIDEDGNVSVNGKVIDEPYLQDKALGQCDITLPYQVPDGGIFVMGDNRSVSVDSRSTTIGVVSDEQIVGKIVFRIWPLSNLGLLN